MKKIFLVSLISLLVLSGQCLWAQNPGHPFSSITVVSDDNYPPFVLRDTDGNLKGIVVDQWQLWEKKTGIKVSLKGMDWKDALETMKQGKADVIDTIFFTRERARIYDFTGPYAKIEVPIFFHKNISGIDSIESVRGFTVGVKKGDACIDIFRQEGIINELVEYNSYEDIIRDAVEDRIRVFCIDNPPALYYLNKYNLVEKYRHSLSLYTGEFHRAVKKGRPELLAVVEDGFSMISNKEQKAIDKKWYGAALPVGPGYVVRYMGIVLGVIAAIIVIQLLFNFLLRRKVQAKTSELVRANRLLQDSEEFRKRVYESSRIPIIVMDAETQRFIDCNPAAVGVYGFSSKEDIVGKTPVDFSAPVQYDGTAPEEKATYYVNVAKEKGSVVFEWKHRRPNGEIWDAEVHLLCFNTGSSQLMQFSLVDITERRQAQEALLASEQKYRNLFENANEAIFIVQDRELVFLNPKTTEMTGYSPEELRARPFIDFIYHDDRDLVMNRHISRLKGEDIPHVYSFRVIRKDGSIRWTELNAVLIKWNGKTATLNFMNDITERRQAEEKLRESEERYRSLVEGFPVGVYRTDQDGYITYANSALAGILGFPDSRSIIGSPTSEFYVNPKDQEEQHEILDRDGVLKEFEAQLRRSDGTIIWVRDSAHSFHQVDGRICLEGTLVDITERKRIMEEREKLQAQLTQAQKMESIGTLAGGIAHNFNNILMGVQGRTSLMMMDKDPSDPDYEHLRGINEYVRNAVEMTRDLLGFARGGKYEVRPTDLNALIKHENRMFGRTKKEIRIHGKYEKNLWAVELDRGQIQQALLNLYVNAWQAMPGGGDLYVHTENFILDEKYIKPFEITPGRYVKISVTDTGVGMDAATREKVFDPFFSTKDIGQGSGLGLASVYGIVKNHGGFINVYSEKGAGTTFTIYLPASEKEVGEEGPGPARHDILYGQGTVLLVDDEGMIIEVGQKMLEKLHYRVLTARSGQEAIELYERQKGEIDLVILDMVMPGMGGGETFDRLKAVNGNVRVLLSSGYSINGQAKEILDRGCSGFIQKPFAMEELSRKVHDALAEGKSDPKGEFS